MVKVTNEKTEQRQAYLKIEVTQEELDVAMEASYRKLAKQVSLPGFRKGKAPRSMCWNSISGTTEFSKRP